MPLPEQSNKVECPRKFSLHSYEHMDKKSESKFPKSVLNEYIQKLASNPDRKVPLEKLEGLADIRVNIDKFNSDNLKVSKLFDVVKKKKNTPQLGCNQIL